MTYNKRVELLPCRRYLKRDNFPKYAVVENFDSFWYGSMKDLYVAITNNAKISLRINKIKKADNQLVFANNGYGFSRRESL